MAMGAGAGEEHDECGMRNAECGMSQSSDASGGHTSLTYAFGAVRDHPVTSSPCGPLWIRSHKTSGNRLFFMWRGILGCGYSERSQRAKQIRCSEPHWAGCGVFIVVSSRSLIRGVRGIPVEQHVHCRCHRYGVVNKHSPRFARCPEKLFPIGERIATFIHPFHHRRRVGSCHALAVCRPPDQQD